MFCLELELIIFSYFLLLFLKYLFLFVYGIKIEYFKNYMFEKNYRFEIVFVDVFRCFSMNDW